MRTSKPLSTISYNSDNFLRNYLNSSKIQFWAFIHHIGENDEAGSKCHFHVYFEPSKIIDIKSWADESKELDLLHPDKPLKCMLPRISRFSDWFLYSLHDQDYLLSKLLVKRYHYKMEDFQTSDVDELRIRIRSIEVPNNQIMRLKKALEVGMNFHQAFWAGLINPQNIRNMSDSWALLEDLYEKKKNKKIEQKSLQDLQE